MTLLQVRTFARYAELVGDPVAVELALPAPLAELISAVHRAPGGGSLPPRPLVAINLAIVGADTMVNPGDEVALLPPLAGG